MNNYSTSSFYSAGVFRLNKSFQSFVRWFDVRQRSLNLLLATDETGAPYDYEIIKAIKHFGSVRGGCIPCLQFDSIVGLGQSEIIL